MLALSLCFGVPAVLAQSTPPAPSPSSAPAPGQTSGQGDNPFPGDAPQAPAPSAPAASAPSSAGQTPGQASGQAGDGKPNSTSKPKRESENPFPGEDPDAPIIPVAPGPGADSGAAARPGWTDSNSDSAGTPRRDADPDGDPVRSPDGDARTAGDDGFASSESGVRQVPVEDDAKPGKPVKSKSRAQTIKDDLDVGGFYLDKKNWKAAEGRFSSAFALDAENPDTVWGLAEAERHLQLYQEAAEHYKLFLSYEPDGKRGREARKALEEVQAAQPSAASKVAPPVK